MITDSTEPQASPATTQSLRVSAATPAMLGDILTLLKGFNNQKIGQKDWQNFLQYPWRDPNSPFGFVLIDGTKIVGFIATIFSPPLLPNPERLCNISSWILKEDYRARGLGFSLIKELLKSPHCTFTNMSPSPNTLRRLRKLGFIELEDFQTILTPLTLVHSFWKSRNVEITQDTSKIGERLTPLELSVFQDHLTFPCKHFHVQSDKGTCYGIFTVSSVGRYRIAHLHYLSNLEGFLSTAGQVSLWMLKTHQALKVIIENRLLKGRKIPFSVERPFPNVKLYRPGTLTKENITNAYSEIVMLP